MTVAQLIDILQTFPQDLPVYTEGCDCIGPADGADVVHHNEDYVVINRSEEG